jgi:hypothetical protein
MILSCIELLYISFSLNLAPNTHCRLRWLRICLHKQMYLSAIEPESGFFCDKEGYVAASCAMFLSSESICSII